MFAPFMTNAWIAGTVVAVIAGSVGFFVVLRGNAFMAHAVPHGAFAGAAGAVLIGIDPLIGLGIFATVGAITITLLERRTRQDVVTALTLTMMLALGALFLSRSTEYSAEVYALLFGQILGVSSFELVPMSVLGVLCIAVLVVAFRPLLFASLLPPMAEAKGVRVGGMSLVFALVLACATAMSVPVTGALLMFALLVGPPATARSITAKPLAAVCLSVVIALATVWCSIALAYETDWPIGFFVTAVSALGYAAGRLARAATSRRRPLVVAP